jgi:uncharacterized protein
MNRNLLRILIAAFAAMGIIAGIFLLTHPRSRVSQGRGHPAQEPRNQTPAPMNKGAIAIVIDDFGYTSRNFEVLSQIHFPLTLSILPNLQFSGDVGERFHKRFEIVLHLPMEPKERTGLEENTILSGMDAVAIRKIIDQDLANLKYARGVSNHMGSRVTEDPLTLGLVFSELKKRGLFFLDSFVTAKSVVPEAAQNAAIHWARRDVFLDNQLTPDYIRKRLSILKRKAQAGGSAIGVCHDRSITLGVLREEMPKMAAEGYQFVVVSDLLN